MPMINLNNFFDIFSAMILRSLVTVSFEKPSATQPQHASKIPSAISSAIYLKKSGLFRFVGYYFWSLLRVFFKHSFNKSLRDFFWEFVWKNLRQFFHYSFGDVFRNCNDSFFDTIPLAVVIYWLIPRSILQKFETPLAYFLRITSKISLWILL